MVKGLAKSFLRKKSKLYIGIGVFLLLVYIFNLYYKLSVSDYKNFWLDPSLYWNKTEYSSVTLGDGINAYLFAGIPETDENVKVIKNSAYWVGYNEDRNLAQWVGYRIARDQIKNTAPRPETFIADFRTFPPVSPDNYTRTGYDRGHMAPNYAISTFYPEQVHTSFLMSNIVPQRPDLNRKIWRELEMKIAKEYAMRFKEVWVLMGPIFNDKDPKKINFLPIPDAFFKIIIIVTNNNEVRVLAFEIPQEVNGNEPLEHFLSNVELIESKVNMNLLPEWPEEWRPALYNTYRRVW